MRYSIASKLTDFVSLLLSVAWIFTFSSVGYAQSESAIIGTVTDEGTGDPLPGVHVVLHGLDRGTATDEDGVFRIDKLLPGVYTVAFSHLGYESRILPDIVVGSNRPARIVVTLSDKHEEGDEIKVVGAFYDRELLGSTSRVRYSSEEIRRAPGSGREITRVLSALPGVISTGDNSQDLIVRGGSPIEIGFYIDDVPVPTTYHFEQLNGHSNGPIGMINSDLVERMTFSAGGHSSEYGHHLSGLVDLQYREGSRDRLHGLVGIDLAGASLLAEGPLHGGSGSWMISGRRSYLDFLANIAEETTSVPGYGDVHLKVTHDLDQHNDLLLLNVFGRSFLRLAREDAEEVGQPIYPDYMMDQNTVGIRWRSFPSRDVFTTLTLSHTYKSSRTEQLFTESGDRESRFDVSEHTFRLRSLHHYRLNDTHRLEVGADLGWYQGEFDYYLAPFRYITGEVRSESNRQLTHRYYDASAFGTWRGQLKERLSGSVGVRFDHAGNHGQWLVSPRASLSYQLAGRVAFNASAGVYRQQLPGFIQSQDDAFARLVPMQSTHLIVGSNILLSDEALLTIELYDKQFRSIPIVPRIDEKTAYYPPDMDLVFVDLESSGKGYARGIDLMLQRRMSDNFYGTISTSFFRSRYTDYAGAWRDRSYDVQYVFDVTGGYRLNDRWEVSARWNLTGPRPHTPIDRDLSAQYNMTMWDMSRYNAERLPAFHALYVRMDRRFFFERYTLTTFLSLWNAYNQSNINMYYWNANEQRIDTLHEFALLPVFGLNIEF